MRPGCGFRANSLFYLQQSLPKGQHPYAYRLTAKGTKVVLFFVLSHKQLCGPLANSLFNHQPNAQLRPKSKLETAYHKVDASMRNIIELLEAA